VLEGNQLKVRGWVASADPAQQIQTTLLKSGEETLYRGEFQIEERPDVAKALGKPDLVNAGWIVRLDWSGKPAPSSITPYFETQTGEILSLPLSSAAQAPSAQPAPPAPPEALMSTRLAWLAAVLLAGGVGVVIYRVYQRRGNNVSNKMYERLFVIILIVAPVLITYCSVLGSHTLSYNNFQTGYNPTRGVDVLSILDPAAGSYQDEPWSYFIGSHWVKGEFPLINQANGLGAPLLASLQSGPLYPGNILLTLIPKLSPQFFDIFCVIHVFILAWGMYLLGTRFTNEPWIAALIAGSFAAGLGVVYNINMVHFRVFAWAPWIALGLVDLIKKPGRNIFAATIFAVATFSSFSAGNPQESIINLGASMILACSVITRDVLYKRIFIIILAVLCIMFIIFPIILPYIIQTKSCDLWSVADPQRSGKSIPLIMLLDMVLPHGSGVPGNLWLSGLHFHHLQFAWPAAWLIGFIGIVGIIRQSRAPVWIFVTVLPALLLLCVICGVGPWAWLSHIPFINGILFIKYTLSLAILLLPLAVAGLSFVVKKCRSDTTSALRYSIIVPGIYLSAVFGLFLNKNWQPDFGLPAVKFSLLMTFFSISGAIILPYIFTLRFYKIYLILWTLFISIALRPAGFRSELNYDVTPRKNPPSHLVASDFTDANWENGVSRTNPGFFIADSKCLEILGVGDLLTFESGRKLPIKMIRGNQVWLSGDNKLDPVFDGYPNKIVVSDDVKNRFQKLKEEFSQTWPRVVDPSYSPNTNLILGHASPWVFDPVMNARYRDLMIKEFKVSNPFFNTEPLRPFHFSERQVDVLRMLGVGVIYGSQLDTNPYYTKVGSNTHLIKFGLLPEGLLIPENAVSELSALFTEGKYGDFVNFALNFGTPCTISLDGPNSINAEVPPASDSRRLLLNRVFMSGWKTSNSDALPLANFWLSTPVGPAGGKIVISYWPPGLTLGMIFAGIGVIGLTLIIYLDYRIHRLH
jgi:hypothetical protein